MAAAEAVKSMKMSEAWPVALKNMRNTCVNFDLDLIVKFGRNKEHPNQRCP